MLRKTIEFATLGTRLSVAHRQLVVERPDMPKATLPIEDLGVVIVDDLRATYTQAVFIELLAAGATVLVTGKDHLPAGMMLPLDGHHAATERHRAQIEASEPVRKRAWQSLIMAKITQQGHVLKAYTPDDGGLAVFAKTVRSGDPDNREAQAAQRYWPRLFGKAFRRDRHAEGANAALNYGYAILRAAIARAIVAAGLIPSLGVFHKNRSNAFCLADDLLEPYRPFVDWRVKRMAMDNGDAPLVLDDRPTRAALLSIFNETIVVGGRRLPLLLGMEASAASLARTLTGGDRALALPEGMPLKPQDIPVESD
jgi:CRISP-associated protein Cas1